MDGAEIETDKTIQPSVLDYNRFILEEIGLSKDDIYSNYILCRNKYKSFFDSSDKDKKELFTIPRSNETGKRYREIGVRLRNNWLYSPDHESKDLKRRRFKCYQMMSDETIEDDYAWCFSDTHYVPYEFLDRYEAYLKSK